jgi:hypothetical protein
MRLADGCTQGQLRASEEKKDDVLGKHIAGKPRYEKAVEKLAME